MVIATDSDPRRPSVPLDAVQAERDQNSEETQQLYNQHWEGDRLPADTSDEQFISDQFENVERCLESFNRHEGFSYHIKRLEARQLRLLTDMTNLTNEEPFRMLQARAWAMGQLIKEFKDKTVYRTND